MISVGGITWFYKGGSSVVSPSFQLFLSEMYYILYIFTVTQYDLELFAEVESLLGRKLSEKTMPETKVV